MSSHYAGTYFGIAQALRIDALRQAAENLAGWERDVAMTALTAAMSACAYTAGKHFAQPHKLSQTKDLTFHGKRALADRSVRVDAVYRAAVAALCRRAHDATSGHSGHQATLSELGDRPAVDLVYADPPYTAQQYSRFYHVPEVVYDNSVPELQIHRGRLTTGLYPTDRFKSDFCSKRKAAAGFERLCALAAARGAQLLVSYSGTRATSGNDRMIGLPDLQALLGKYGPVETHQLNHNYRQFNSIERAVSSDSDPEYLILCRVRAC